MAWESDQGGGVMVGENGQGVNIIGRKCPWGKVSDTCLDLYCIPDCEQVCTQLQCGRSRWSTAATDYI